MKAEQQQRELVSTARIAGVWYLMLAITGMVGFLLLHSRIYVTDDPSKHLLIYPSMKCLPGYGSCLNS